MELTVVVRKDGASYWSEVAQLPGCFASGRTLDELGEALAEALGLYLNDDELELSGPRLGVGTNSVRVSGR